MPRDRYSMSPTSTIYTNTYTLINTSNTKANNNKHEEKTCMTTCENENHPFRERSLEVFETALS